MTQEARRASMPDWALNPAARQVTAFDKRFGQPHLCLAQHAAFPLALTPRLAYQLWAHFSCDCQGQKLNIPWIAVADLLLSGLCKEVGYELYEMDADVRNELLERMERDERFQGKRIEELSDLLLGYVQREREVGDRADHEVLQAQEWTALAYVRPNEAACSLAQALGQAYPEPRPELVRLASVTEALAKPLAGFVPLLWYARGIARWARGDVQGARDELAKCTDQTGQVTVQGEGWSEALPVPEELIPIPGVLERRTAMDKEQLLELARLIREEGKRAQKEGRLGEYSVLADRAEKLEQWVRGGQQGDPPPNLDEYRSLLPAQAAGQEKPAASLPVVAPPAGALEEEPVAGMPPARTPQERQREKELRERLHDLRVNGDTSLERLREERATLRELLELHPSDEAQLGSELASVDLRIQQEEEKTAGRDRLAALKRELRDPWLLQDQVTLKAALEKGRVLRAEGAADEELLQLLMVADERYRQIAEQAAVALSFRITELYEDEIRTYRDWMRSQPPITQIESEQRPLSVSDLLAQAHQAYGKQLRERVDQRKQEAEGLMVQHPRRALEELEEAQRLVQHALEETLADIEKATRDDVDERLEQVRQRADQWGLAHQAVEQAAQAPTSAERLRSLLLARERYSEYVGDDGVSLADKIARAIEPVSAEACSQMDGHLGHAQACRSQRRFPDARQACEEGLQVPGALPPDAVTSAVKEREASLRAERQKIDAAETGWARLQDLEQQIGELLAASPPRIVEAGALFDQLQSSYPEEDETRRLAVALAASRDRGQVVTQARMDLGRDPDGALGQIEALIRRGIDDEEVLFLQAQALEKLARYDDARQVYDGVQRKGGAYQQEAQESLERVDRLVQRDKELIEFLRQLDRLEKHKEYKQAAALLDRELTAGALRLSQGQQSLAQRSERIRAKWREQLYGQMTDASRQGKAEVAASRAIELEKNSLDWDLKDEIMQVKSAYYRQAAESAASSADRVRYYRELSALWPQDKQVTEKLLEARKHETLERIKRVRAQDAVASLRQLCDDRESAGLAGDSDVLSALADAHRRAMEYEAALEVIARCRRLLPSLPQPLEQLQERTTLEMRIAQDLDSFSGGEGDLKELMVNRLADAAAQPMGPAQGFVSDELQRRLGATTQRLVNALLATGSSGNSQDPAVQLEVLQHLVWVLRLQPREPRALRVLAQRAVDIPVLVEWQLVRLSGQQRLQGVKAVELLQEASQQVIQVEVLLEAAQQGKVVELRGMPRDLAQKLQQLEQGIERVRRRRDELRVMVSLMAPIGARLQECRTRQQFERLRMDLEELGQVAVAGTTDVQEMFADYQERFSRFTSAQDKAIQLQVAYQEYQDLGTGAQADLRQLNSQCLQKLAAVRSLCQEIARVDPGDDFGLQQHMLAASLPSGSRVAVPNLQTLLAVTERDLKNLKQWNDWHGNQWQPAVSQFQTVHEQWREAMGARDRLRQQLSRGLSQVEGLLGRPEERQKCALAFAKQSIVALQSSGTAVTEAYNERPADAYSPAAQALQALVEGETGRVEEALQAARSADRKLDQDHARADELSQEIMEMINQPPVDWDQADRSLAEMLSLDPTHPHAVFFEEGWEGWKEENGR